QQELAAMHDREDDAVEIERCAAHHPAHRHLAHRLERFLDPGQQSLVDAHAVVSFSPAMQATMPRMSSIRIVVCGSPYQAMPTTPRPLPPIPAPPAQAGPSGSG